MSKDLRDGGLDRLTVEDILQPGFSTPWDAPTIPPFPFTFRNVEVLTLVWRTTEQAVARLLPPPLEPASDVVLAHIYKMNDTEWLGPYGESNVSVRTCSSHPTSASRTAARCTGNPKRRASRGSSIAVISSSAPSPGTAST